MIRQLVFALAASFTLGACATPMTQPQASAGEGVVVLSLTADAPDDARISGLEYRIRPIVTAGGERAITKRHSSSVTEQFRRAAADNARRAADNLHSRVDVISSNVTEESVIRKDGRAVGRVVVLHLPPGDYELAEWTLWLHDAQGRTEMKSPSSRSYRFRVEADAQQYLGNVHLSVAPEGRFRQISRDEAGRDVSLAEQLDAQVSRSQLVYRPLDAAK